ncbi:MAG TPA: hypothetical protein VJR24_01785 [Gemmatimonadaceae bacterium]|nr:hypothetical protein [Gemmatimonadaceae bacterium]
MSARLSSNEGNIIASRDGGLPHHDGAIAGLAHREEVAEKRTDARALDRLPVDQEPAAVR